MVDGAVIGVSYSFLRVGVIPSSTCYLASSTSDSGRGCGGQVPVRRGQVLHGVVGGFSLLLCYRYSSALSDAAVSFFRLNVDSVCEVSSCCVVSCYRLGYESRCDVSALRDVCLRSFIHGRVHVRGWSVEVLRVLGLFLSRHVPSGVVPHVWMVYLYDTSRFHLNEGVSVGRGVCVYASDGVCVWPIRLIAGGFIFFLPGYCGEFHVCHPLFSR